TRPRRAAAGPRSSPARARSDDRTSGQSAWLTCRSEDACQYAPAGLAQTTAPDGSKHDRPRDGAWRGKHRSNHAEGHGTAIVGYGSARRNRARHGTMVWNPELEELRRRQKLAESMGGADKVQRQRAGGRLTVRERIDQLVDTATFHEIGAIA